MSWEPIRVFPCTMGAGSTFTSHVDFKRFFHKIALLMPTMTSASDFYVLAAESPTSDFRRVRVLLDAKQTATVSINNLVIASGATNCIIELPLEGLRYVKLEATTANVAALGFKFICGG